MSSRIQDRGKPTIGVRWITYKFVVRQISILFIDNKEAVSCMIPLFRYPFHPRVTAVARKRSRSFCQKCRWQVTAKHAYTLRMWLCMKWHGAWLYGVHRTCAGTAAVSCGTSHASAVRTPLRRILKTTTTRYKASYSCRTTCKRSESAQESGEQRYISDHQSISWTGGRG